MRFGNVQAVRFGTRDGAYSEVTEREHYDSQITVTDYEADLLTDHFERHKIHVGKVSSNPVKALKPFLHYPDGRLIHLNLVFPKPGRLELRLYLSERAGFKPSGGEVWFVFRKDGKLWLGSMDLKRWRMETNIYRDDYSDEYYQAAVNEGDPIWVQKHAERDAYGRDANLALRRMELAGYRCEFDQDHELFLSRRTGRPYLESHHVIPMEFQEVLGKKLDVIENISCLCPRCHRAVHHAEESLARTVLAALVRKRDVFRFSGINEYELQRLYSIEAIE